MTARQATAGNTASFVGRDTEIAAALGVVATRPGLLVVVADRGVGATRFSAEVAARLVMDGAVRVRLGLNGRLPDRLAAGLEAAELRPDPLIAAQHRPFVAVVDDIDASGEATRIGHGLVGTQGLLIACAREIPEDAAFVELTRLGDATAREIVIEAAPTIGDTMLARVLELAAGRPGVLVPLARANHRRVSDDTPINIPPVVMRSMKSTIDAIDPAHLDIARWTAVLGGVFEPTHLVRLTGRTEEGCAATLDGLVASKFLQGLADPGPTRMRFADPLVAAAIRQSIPASDLRRRHTAVLSARRARGDDATDLVQHAMASADPREVVGLSLRAATSARERGDPATALTHAERALLWSERHRPESEHLEAMLEQGLALAGLGEWDRVEPVLGQVIRRQRRAGNEGAAVRAATEWARVRWYAGDRLGAFELIEANVAGGDGPLAERAKAMTQAAMFASNAGRHTEALAWATRARAEALACDDHMTAILALNALALSTIRSTASPAGLAYFREAFHQARGAGLLRQAAVTLNNESVSLLAMGLVRQAADRAQEGLDIVETNGIAEIDAPLTHNLAEALTALGRLRGARRLALRSREAFLALGIRSNEHLDGVLAWLDFTEGKVDQALAALRAISGDHGEEETIEFIGSLSAYHVHAAHAAGELEEARSVARTGVAHWRETEDRVDALGLLGAACEVLPADEAKPVLDELQAAADAGAPIAAAFLPYARAWAARSASARASAFREASMRFAATDMVWWAARTLMLAGESVQTPQAVEDLLEARRMFRDMEATIWRARCEAGLRARGHRFVMVSRQRDAGLTEREKEVLEQVAKGLTNQQIAACLYITDTTVGHHLERIFSKLGVLSRTAAVSAGVEHGLVIDVSHQSNGEISMDPGDLRTATRSAGAAAT